MIRLVLFDWNGTLIDDSGVWDAARCENFRSFGVEPPPLERYLEALVRARGDYRAAYAEFGVDVTDSAALNETYEHVYRQRIGEIRLIDGAIEVLDGLNERGIPRDIVSTQTPKLFWATLARFPEVRDRVVRSRCNVVDKVLVIRTFAGRRGIATRECAYVGGMPSDAAHAKRAGAVAIIYRAAAIPDAIFDGITVDHQIDNLREILAIVDGEREAQRAEPWQPT